MSLGINNRTTNNREQPSTFSLGNTLYVGGDGPGNYSTIQSAIDDANPGDTVYVYNGTYYENLDISKCINLIGENRSNTVIEGIGLDSVVYISADWVNISGFTIQLGKKNGIFLDSSKNNTIKNNIIRYNCVYGVEINNSICNNIVENDISSNNHFGIHIRHTSNNNLIRGNNIQSHSTGIWLAAESNWNTIIYNNFKYHHFEAIDISFSNNNTIQGNTVSHTQWVGIDVDHGSYNIISNNNISMNGIDGICLNWGCMHNTIKDNNVYSNEDDGISLVWASYHNIIMDNNVYLNKDNGIALCDSVETYIAGNKISNNIKYGMYLYKSSNNNTILDNSFIEDGLRIENSYFNNVFNNTINNKPLVYLENESNKEINHAGQVILINCDNICVQNQELSNTDFGIGLWNTKNCIILGNNISSNYDDGIKLEHSSDNNIIMCNKIYFNNNEGIAFYWDCINNIISSNLISKCNRGIYIHFSDNGIILGNNVFSNNREGIWLAGSGNFKIYHNNVINNSRNAIESTNKNEWDDGYPSGGNYWDDYTGEDNDEDGIGDIPYPIYPYNGNEDRYPLMYPWSGNHPPFTPTINGPTSGKAREFYNYDFTFCVDPDCNDMTYHVEWDDGGSDEGFVASGGAFTLTHSWDTEDTFTIRAKLIDIYGAESNWATYDVTITKKSRAMITPFLNWLQNHLNLFPILHRLLFLLRV